MSDTVSPQPRNGNWPFEPFPLTSGIYQITNTLTGDFYIGSSADIYKRWKEHIRKLRVNKNGCIVLQRAWNKYGEEAFTFSIIEETEREKIVLLDRENYYLKTLEPAYNVLLIANSALGVKRSEETLEKLRQRTISEEQKEHIRQCNIGKKASSEALENMRRAQQSRYANTPPEHREAHKAAQREAAKRPETKRRMSEAQTINNNRPGAREKQSQSHLGYKQTPEHIENHRKSREGYTTSEATKEKLRQANLGKTYPPEVALKQKETRERNKREREQQMQDTLWDVG